MESSVANFTRRDSERHRIKGSFFDYVRHREFLFLDSIVQSLFPQNIPRYLDFACGTGQILSHMENKAQSSYGMDLRQSMMEGAKGKCPKSHFLLGDITKDEFQGVEPFHLITAFRYFGKAQDGMRRTVLSKLNDYLVDGGYFIFNNHRNPWSAIRIYKRLGKFLDTYSDLSYLKIKKHLKNANFRIVRTYGIGWWLLSPRMNTNAVCNSKWVQRLEPLSMIPIVIPFCPDMIIVAQKKARNSMPAVDLEGESPIPPTS